MPEFNKSRGFKMSGYSYPGKSPLKGKKKRAQQAKAAEDLSTAQEKLDKFGEMEMKSTDIMAQESKIGKGGAPKKGYIKPAPTKSWAELGQLAAKEVVKAGVSTGVKAATGGFKKDKPGRRGPDASGLASIKFGKR